MPTPETFDLTLVKRETIAADIVQLTLARPDNGDLPSWEPGAHIDLHLGEQPTMIRQYSLCSSPADPTHYQVAVLREPQSRGGSTYVIDHLHPGDTVPISPPRNHFALVPSRRYVFVAGGIGITPIIPMIEAAAAADSDWNLLYGGRTRETMAFATELIQAWGPRVSVRPQDEFGLLDLQSLLASPAPNTAIYCCGPSPLLDAVEAATASWPAGTLHTERFAPATPTTSAGTEFEVEFVQSGVTLPIPADRTILEVAEEAGLPVVYSCEEGTCGVCETKIICGEPDHRDSVLTGTEQQAGNSMMICISRARSSRLVLEL
ncbi:oxidoreductase [Williamsia sp. 1138]|uniref:PDR/VanB family oxidoreductase n=1 Tax=Williamsia sp. 1138 TaxID=1903117 RepID=UPI000A11509B|nr:PDR/VanB family oxidoreductase [Williamsia sp. 1138]OZG26170.1 oxidoreductase [Williamsia sp. 1138]